MQKSLCLSNFRTESKTMQMHSNMGKKKVISRRSVALGLIFFAAPTYNIHLEKFNVWMLSESGN